MANGTQNRQFVIRNVDRWTDRAKRQDDDTTYPLSLVYRHVDLRKNGLEEIASFPSATDSPSGRVREIRDNVDAPLGARTMSGVPLKS